MMSKRSGTIFLFLVAVIVVLFLFEVPIERAVDRLYYAPWAYGNETLTGVWNGRLSDGTPFTLTLMREEEAGIPAPTDAQATVVGFAGFAGESWPVTGVVNRSASDIELIVWQGTRDNISGFLNGKWTGTELLLSGEIKGQATTIQLTQKENQQETIP